MWSHVEEGNLSVDRLPDFPPQSPGKRGPRSRWGGSTGKTDKFLHGQTFFLLAYSRASGVEARWEEGKRDEDRL